MDSYLVCYDIRDPKRLKQVASTCEDFGYRRQYSVFLCRITELEMLRLRIRLEDIINREEDQVLIIPMCRRCVSAITCIGQPTEPVDAKDLVVII
ncbi:MAG: CRISPR-associated endonuclease Cas2 [Gemmataceae bacterium]